MLVVGLGGVVLVPAAGYLWAVLVGLANGAMFPLGLTLPLDVEDRRERVGALVGMMLGVGYTVAGPFALGALCDATGTFTQALWPVFAFGASWLVCALLVPPQRLRRHSLATAGAQ